jgi:modification target Cys-rich repeat protein
MRKVVFGLGAVLAPVLVGSLMATGCSDENGDGGLPGVGNPAELCGPCGDIVQGDVGISGDARIDGVFKALGNMRNATLTIQADFDGEIRALAEVWGVEITGEVNADVVEDLVGEIEAEITANVQGELVVDYQPPRCEASVNVAVDVQAKCEVKAGCMVDVNPGEVSVACEGTCTGGCTGECSGEFSCEVTAPSIQCEGQCEGSCELAVAATCEGTCRGECDGTCSAQDSMGACAGSCDGTCEGTCELSAAASCSGTCTGKCLTTPPSGGCEAEASCRGSCSAQCEGSCEGNFTPPSASAECEASADCQASARAEAQASLECTPPQLTVDFALQANLDAEARAAFTAKMRELRVRGAAIIQGAAKYEALITGEVEGRVVFETSPLEDVQARLTALADINFESDFNVPVLKAACLLDAFGDAVDIAGDLATDTGATIEAQAAFVGAFSGGFGG